MIYINPTNRDFSLGDDNFWVWFERVFYAKLYVNHLDSKDILVNSSFHRLENYTGVINLHLELMKEIVDKYTNLRGMYNSPIKDILYNCKNSNITVLPSKLMYKDYKDICKNIEVVPIGVDLEVFKPLNNKKELRDKYHIPSNKQIGFWAGNTGVWRGLEEFKKFCEIDTDTYWIVNYYRGAEVTWAGLDCSVFFRVNQHSINELLNASDFYLCTNQLGPYYMSDWEAIAANVPVVDTTDLARELGNAPTRDKLISAGWGRDTVESKWLDIIDAYHNI